MFRFVILFVFVACLTGGCLFGRKSAELTPEERAALLSQPITPAGQASSDLIIVPDFRLTGQVTTFNAAGRFVVLNFPLGSLPVRDQVMFVYRRGLQVGEVRVTGPEEDNNTVADLISGEAAKGDEVRDK